MLGKAGEFLRVVFGEEEGDPRLEKGGEEEDPSAAKKAELKADLGADDRIEKQFDQKRSAEEIQSACMAGCEFADEIKEGC